MLEEVRLFTKYYNEHNCASEKIQDNMSEEEAYQLEKDLISKCQSNVLCNLDEGGRKLGIFIGKDNPMYGISPKMRMSQETYENWHKKHKDVCGEKNANYGKHTLKGRKQSQKHIEHRSGSNRCKKDFSQYLLDNNLDSGNLDNIRHRMNWSIKKYGEYKGFIIKEK